MLRLLLVRRGDELQEGRIKVIHSFGSTAKVALQFTPGAARFTGIYGGTSSALCRISPARMAIDSFTPGMGIKVRKGALSRACPTAATVGSPRLMQGNHFGMAVMYPTSRRAGYAGWVAAVRCCCAVPE